MFNTTDKKAKEFLLYSYFKILPINSYKPEKHNYLKYDQYLTRQCAYRAYLDLNRTLTVNKEVSDEGRKELVYGICSKLIDYIEALFYKTSDKDFDTTHDKICTALKNYINDENKCSLLSSDSLKFTYGQSQKWLNMTLKYMWLLGLLDGKIKTEFLHVPVDSYIIKAVWQFDDIKLPLIEGKLLKDKSRGKYSAEKVDSWSKWDDENVYKNFQKTLQDSLPNNTSRIEWEHSAWMENAE